MNNMIWLFPVFIVGVAVGFNAGWIGAIESIKDGYKLFFRTLGAK